MAKDGPDCKRLVVRPLRRLIPGCYVDPDNHLHVDFRELLHAVGWPDTPENRLLAWAAASEELGPAYGAGVPSVIHERWAITEG